MFSPYYRAAHRRGRGIPENHAALNVCLYGGGADRWTMTERASRHLERGPDHIRIGPSAWRWEDGGLTVDIQEIANPIPRPVRGRLRITPGALCTWSTPLDAAGRHRWGPIAPCSRISVELESPRLRWSGHAYVDSNEGDEPLERGFATWDWLRAPLDDGSCAVVYDLRPRSGGERLVARRFLPDGSTAPFEVAARGPLPTTRIWRIARQVCTDPGGVPRLVRTLEDTPFYARSMVRLPLAGQSVEAVHETLDADRFASRWVQALLPWRMPRRW